MFCYCSRQRCEIAPVPGGPNGNVFCDVPILGNHSRPRLPLPVAYAACSLELLGGVGLLLGLFTRLAALAIIAMMAGAIAKVHWPHGFFINWELAPGKGHGLEANLAFIAMAVACVIAGGGALSLDALLMG